MRVDVLGKITESILGGLVYLYEAHRIMHRDIKPSNVLVNSQGQIKLCDFGVATETVNSVADTFVGTSTYMAPERIQGGAYTIKSDVWSVGLTVMELAIGRFPFDASDSSPGDRASAGPMGILDLLQTIVHEPAPKLPKSDAFPAILDEFVSKCLLKNPEERPTPRQLYDRDAFLRAAKRTPVNLQEWAVSMMERHNRKSYLAPPAPKSLNRDGTTGNGNVVSPGQTSTTSQTPVTSRRFVSPTSGDIPVMAVQSPPRFVSQRSASDRQIPTGIAERSPPPPLSLQHLSLESPDEPMFPTSRSNRLQFSPKNNQPEPASAIDGHQRPMYPPRTSSTTMNGTTLPMRAPPPTGPLPAPPIPGKAARGAIAAGFNSPRRNQ